MSPYSPTRSPASFMPLIEVLRQTRSPHTIGLDSPRPGIGVFHAMPSFDATFHLSAVACASDVPSALMPRNCGQSTPGRGADAAKGHDCDAAAPRAPVTSRALAAFVIARIDGPPESSAMLSEDAGRCAASGTSAAV